MLSTQQPQLQGACIGRLEELVSAYQVFCVSRVPKETNCTRGCYFWSRAVSGWPHLSRTARTAAKQTRDRKFRLKNTQANTINDEDAIPKM